MKPAPFHPNDDHLQGGSATPRPAAVGSDPAAVAIARLARRLTGCDIGALAAVDGGVLRLLQGDGVAPPHWGVGPAACPAAALDEGALEVPDWRLDPRFAGSALGLLAPSVTFFAAVPVLVEGACRGAVCVMDPHHRALDAEQLAALADLAVLAGPMFAARHGTTLPPVDATSGRIAPSAVDDALYRAVTSAVSDGLAVLGAECRILATNPAACDILGITADRMIGQRLGELGFELRFEDGRSMPDVDHPVRRVLQGGTSLADRVHSLHRPDGSTRLVQMSVRPLGGLGSVPPAACLVTLRDITRQREAEHALRDRQATDLANRAKSEFLSRVSHEMRTPLNAVIGFTQLLRLSPDASGPQQVASYTDHVLRASEQLLALINDLLDLQRVDEGRLALQPRSLALRRQVEATFELLQPLADRHGVVLHDRTDADAWVRADAQRLRQVLLNVASNAIKYNRSGGWVSMGVAPGEGARWVLTVEDSGSGLTQDQLARLFQPFERLGHESTGIEGSGLGLVIARRLVEEMGGELTLSSRPSDGTQVRIALPRAEAAPTAAAATGVPRGTAPSASGTREYPSADHPGPDPAPEAAPGTPMLRMLYVEDNRINAILFEEAVRMHGRIELQVAEDGAEALALVRDWVPHVLVLDAHLPDMSGYEVLARLRDVPGMQDVPAFMCSADAMEEDLERATVAGFVGYWTKPIDIARVMRDLDRLVGSPVP